MTAKEYLEQYSKCKRRLEQMDDQLNTISESIDSLSINYSGMPHGSDIQSKVESYVIKMEEKQESLVKERLELLELMMQIADAIREVEDDTYSRLLHCRYIVGMNWDDVANTIGYDDSYTRGYMHGKALLSVKVPTQSDNIQQHTTKPLC